MSHAAEPSTIGQTAVGAEQIVVTAGEAPDQTSQRDTGLLARVTASPLGGVFLRAWSSDWIKALLIGPVFLFIPGLILLDIFVQCVRRVFGLASSSDKHTARGRTVIVYFFQLDLSAICVRICVLGELWWTLNVGFTRITYIFLSWLNEQLASVHIAAVSVLVVVVGFLMFMIPVVPGIPVYVFSGIVLASQKQSIGLLEAIVLATVLSVATKLCACTGEYFIGLRMGQSIKVQQLIGVDKVATRAIEKILNKRGLAISKVTILIGGPDWPTSVTCGILRINVPQMVLGTLPIVLICTPCVVAGACLTRVTGASDDPWKARSALAILASTIGQGGAFCLAVYFVGETVAKYGEELEKPRPEHRVVEELTRQEQAFDQAYRNVTAWARLSFVRKSSIVFATTGQLFSNFIFTMVSSKCFRKFQLSSKIADSYDAEPPGLNGDPFSILLFPTGGGMLVLFFVSAFIHYMHCKSSGWNASRELTSNPPTVENGPSSANSGPTPIAVRVRPTGKDEDALDI